METAVWNIVIMIKESSPDQSGHSWESFWSGVGEWFEEHWVEVALGSVVVIGGAAVTALTCYGNSIFGYSWFSDGWCRISRNCCHRWSNYFEYRV